MPEQFVNILISEQILEDMKKPSATYGVSQMGLTNYLRGKKVCRENPGSSVPGMAEDLHGGNHASITEACF